MRLSGAILFVKDLDRMAQFYEGSLGLKSLPDSQTEGWLGFEDGFGLHAIPTHIADEIEITSPPQVRAETPLKLIFQVDDLSMEVARLQAHSIRVELKPWGTADGVDPEGNVFSLTQR